MKRRSWQAGFLELMPSIEEQARYAARKVPRWRRDDFVQEVICLALWMYLCLWEKGREDLGFSTPLAQYGIRQANDCRSFGNPLNVRDTSSRYCQQRNGFCLLSLYRYEPKDDVWKEIVVEDKKTTPAATAVSRLDIAEWFASLPKRTRKIANALSLGERTKDVANRFHLSDGRISQLREQLRLSWEQFGGDHAE